MPDTIYAAEEIIFTKGDPSDFAYLIRTGSVEILNDYPDNPVQIAIVNDGHILGEMGLVDERPRSLTARAITETRVSSISRDEFIDLILNNPQEAFQYLRTFFERLRAMNMKIAHAESEAVKETSPEPATKESAVSRDGWEVVLIPETSTLANMIGSERLPINKFPFRFGRQSKRRRDPLEVNDVSIADSPPFNISRNHFSIEKKDEGVFIHDRGSFLGTIVNGSTIGGGKNEAWIALDEGENEIIVGSSHSPFRFKIEITDK